MSYYAFPASGGISTIACVRVLLMIAQIIQRKVAWPFSVLPVHRSGLTLNRSQNGNPRIGAPKLVSEHPSLSLTSERLLYRPQMVADGNMKLVHLRMKHPEDDVSLSDGELFNVTRKPYDIHISQAPERQSVSRCCAQSEFILIM